MSSSFVAALTRSSRLVEHVKIRLYERSRVAGTRFSFRVARHPKIVSVHGGRVQGEG